MDLQAEYYYVVLLPPKEQKEGIEGKTYDIA
jgi:hypothetical protein